MADDEPRSRPKPPKIKPPTAVPGKETARRIGVDTAFIDGLTAGLTGEDEPTSSQSGPLFKSLENDEPSKDEDPLAALIPDLPAGDAAQASPIVSTPSRKDDLLAALASSDSDPKIAALLPSGPSPSERSGDQPLPKGPATPAFEGARSASRKGASASTATKAGGASAETTSDDGSHAADDAPATAAATDARPADDSPSSSTAREPASRPASRDRDEAAVVLAPTATGPASASEARHPGLWLVAAACVFGIAAPLFGGSDEPPARSAASMERRAAVAPERPPTPARATPVAAGLPAPPPEEPGDDDPLDATANPDPAAASPPEEVIEEEEVIEVEDDAPTRRGKSKRPSAEANTDRSASQLLSDAKVAYSKGRAGEAYRLASESNRKQKSDAALIVKAKAACRLGNEGSAKRAFAALPIGAARREVRPVCRDKGIRLGV